VREGERREEGRSNERFNLVRYFSIAGLVVILLSGVLTSLVLSRIMQDALVRRSEKYAIAVANHLGHHLYEQIIAPQQEQGQTIDWISPEWQRRIDRVLRHGGHRLGVIKIKVYDEGGTIIYSTDPAVVGMRDWKNPGYQQALRGVPSSRLEAASQVVDLSGESFTRDVVETYVPVRMGEGDTVMRVFEIYQDVSDVRHEIVRTRRLVVAATILFASLVFGCLLLIVRRADRIITRQTEELHRKHEALRKLDQLKSDLVNMIIHDLRGPLASIMVNLDVMRMKGDLSAEQAERLKRARQGCESMHKLITDMLDISRMEEGKMPLKREPLVVEELIWPAVQEVRDLADKANKRLIVMVPDDLPTIRADRDLLQRVVTNLVGNAIKHTASGGEIRVTAEWDSGADAVHISVSDDGEGIPPEQLEHIFDKFVRARSGARGTGLGLTFCRMAVEAHGGWIRAQSRVGEGSTFTFAIPVEGD